MDADARGEAIYQAMQARGELGAQVVRQAARRAFGATDADQIFSDKKRCYRLAYADWTWAQICQATA